LHRKLQDDAIMRLNQSLLSDDVDLAIWVSSVQIDHVHTREAFDGLVPGGVDT
jgi:hypothetical protein